MTVLAISLLRLGDLILQRPLLEGLRKKHPQAQIHLLLNKQFLGAEFLFLGLVDRFIYFDRETLQKSCGEKEFSIFWGYQQLKALVQDLNKNQYDTVYNLTHNRMTAYLAGLISAKKYFGIYSRNGEFFGLQNPWIRFFNSYFGKPEATGFHYTELLALSLEIPLAQSSFLPKPFNETKNSKLENACILIQPLTSDAKKNWSLKKSQQLAERLAAKTPYPVYVLGAPFEKEILQKEISAEFLKICSLEEAANLLKSSIALITGDTSIKHLAAIYEVPILELALGSSQPLQIGAYANHSMILQSRVACGPCPHSKPCSEIRHKCSDEMSVSAVEEAVLNLLNATSPDWNTFAVRHKELRLFRTEIRPVIGWSVNCLSIGDQKIRFDEILQQKTMIVEELNRRHHANKEVDNEQRTREVSHRRPEAS